jgi:glycosyltransferase involved in cell wall biosynthesis
MEEIVFFGKFETLKGIDVFLDGVDSLYRNFPEAASKLKLVTFIGVSRPIAGRKAEDYITDRAKSWRAKLQIFSKRSRAENWRYLRARQGLVVVFPSKIENSPTVLIESFQNNVCFLASEVGGAPELIADQYKIFRLFKRNKHALSSRLAELLTYGCHYASMSSSQEETARKQLQWHNNIFQERLTDTSANLEETQLTYQEVPLCVVVPFYNRIHNIDELLISLQKQTYKNFQVVIVNDGSTNEGVSDYLGKFEL